MIRLTWSTPSIVGRTRNASYWKFSELRERSDTTLVGPSDAHVVTMTKLVIGLLPDRHDCFAH